ncbi:OLC1v1005600C1 [Oldenlandia corymbosa var. corymbosa]|uniref:OLC1v1005600C1 n=1 Tax=Oldenlandia corymbosa var. corymbosa TaxID=529605 RepID=A0AAV1DF83_OLDCO|nr:OLC1v1005600C1 [Oldenlandia corymbosa var. corymbosa]
MEPSEKDQCSQPIGPNWHRKSPRREEYVPFHRQYRNDGDTEEDYERGHHHHLQYSPPRRQQHNNHEEIPPYLPRGQQEVRGQNASIRDEMRKIIGMVVDQSPFIPDIRDDPKPRDFDFPKDFTKYSGDTDVSQWLQGYVQGQHESLSDFHRRFICETLQVDNIDRWDVQNGFIQGLNPFGKSSMLRVKHSTKPPRNSQEMWAIVENHIQREHTLKRSQESLTAVGPRDKPRVNKESRTTLPKLDRQLTPLTKLRREILQIHKDELPTPKPLPPNPNRSTEQYCEYHKDHDHDTEDCPELKMEIENEVKSGKFQQYVQGPSG